MSWRNLRATILRVLAPLFFMLLLYLTNVALTADNPKKPYAVSNRDPEVSGAGAIPACESDMYILTPCYDFFWTAQNDPGGVIEVGPLSICVRGCDASMHCWQSQCVRCSTHRPAREGGPAGLGRRFSRARLPALCAAW